MKDVLGKMQDMKNSWRTEVDIKIKECGTAQSDTDFKQEIDKWIELINLLEREKQNPDKQQTVVE